MTTNIKNKLIEDAKYTEDAMQGYFSEEDNDIKSLLDSEKYSLFAGGKRIRPFLTIEFCKLFGGDIKAALPFACAVEMIHTYSLIHDDLPCMDNDDVRRGKPTNHKVFGYSTALLAGDGLLTRAFGVMASNEFVSADTVKAAIKVLSDCAGNFGMVGGQIIDLYGEDKKLPVETLIKLHSMKTGALIRSAAVMGALAAGCSADSPEVDAAIEYSNNIGLAFQIVDDVLDETSSEEVMGKSISDKDNNKTTFMTYYDVNEAKKYATELTAKAISAISDYDGSEILTDFAAYLLERDH